MNVLDHGYVELVEAWGSDERIIESARMSTGKGFNGWGGAPCPECLSAGRLDPRDNLFVDHLARQSASTANCVCRGSGKVIGDEKLLKYLWDHAHTTPFEMAGMTIETKAPILVYREWMRHRTQSYNEMSARYVALPNENYIPSVERVLQANQQTANKQAQGKGPEITQPAAERWLAKLQNVYADVQRVYNEGLELGIAKELARLPVPVGRYSRMRATANLRNWLGFLKLRCAPNAQWEIRQYANAVAKLVEEKFPRTYEVAKESTGLP